MAWTEGKASSFEPGEVLISRRRIAARLARLGEMISKDYAGRCPVLVAVLRGAAFFLPDLGRRLTIPCMFDFIGISRYNAQSRHDGVVRITRDISLDVTGRPVILVEDIVDTGLTISYLKKVILNREPETLQVCTLLNRTARRIADIEIRYSGFELPDVYVVGCGLDHEDLYRNLPDVRRLVRKPWQAAEKSPSAYQ